MLNLELILQNEREAERRTSLTCSARGCKEFGETVFGRKGPNSERRVIEMPLTRAISA